MIHAIIFMHFVEISYCVKHNTQLEFVSTPSLEKA